MRKVESGKGILANLILFSVTLGKVAIGKEIGGMMVRNRIEKGNLPKPYPTEQSKEEMLREQIDSEIIRRKACQMLNSL